MRGGVRSAAGWVLAGSVLYLALLLLKLWHQETKGCTDGLSLGPELSPFLSPPPLPPSPSPSPNKMIIAMHDLKGHWKIRELMLVAC